MRYVLIILFLCSPCFADDVVKFDPDNSVVAGRVQWIRRSVPTDRALNQDDVLIYHSPRNNIPEQKQWRNRGTLPPRPMKYWKVDGNQVVEMSPPEKRAVDDAEAAARQQRLDREAARQIDQLMLQAYTLAAKDQLPTLDIQQLRQDFIRHYKRLLSQ